LLCQCHGTYTSIVKVKACIGLYVWQSLFRELSMSTMFVTSRKRWSKCYWYFCRFMTTYVLEQEIIEQECSRTRCETSYPCSVYDWLSMFFFCISGAHEFATWECCIITRMQGIQYLLLLLTYFSLYLIVYSEDSEKSFFCTDSCEWLQPDVTYVLWVLLYSQLLCLSGM